VTSTDIDDRKHAEERTQQENVALREQIDQVFMFEEIVGSSPALKSITNGTRILADRGASYQGMTYDENSMRFWRTGKLVVRPNLAEQERKHIEHEAEGERLIVELDTVQPGRWTQIRVIPCCKGVRAKAKSRSLYLHC